MLYMKKSNTCSWCHKSTGLPEVFASQVPILEWLEEKIDLYCKYKDISRDELWGENSDWSQLNLGKNWESELLAYDELANTISRRVICKECLIQDDALFKKYYIMLDDDEDIEFEEP
jgi:hypothetical protein